MPPCETASASVSSIESTSTYERGWAKPSARGARPPREDGFAQPRSYVEVDSIDETRALAVEHGGTVLQQKQPVSETSWWAVFADPDGNHIGLFEGSVDS